MKPLLITADVSGNVWKVLVKTGDRVDEEQDLVILESMKMEIPAAAPQAGVVREVHVVEGEAVKEGQSLLIIEPG